MANKVSYIIRLQDQFSATARKIKKQFAGINTRIAVVNRSLNRFDDKLKKAKKRVNALAFVGTVMTAAITLPVALMAKSMVKAASDAVEMKNKFDVVFEGTDANKVAKTFAKDFGVAASTARELMGNTGDLLVGFKFTAQAALDMSNAVVIAGADLTSFQNLVGGIDRAVFSIVKAMVGETESMKLLGVVIRQDTKFFRDNVKQIQRATRATFEQARAVEIFRIILDQSAKSIGDVKRTWNDFANVIRRFSERIKDLKESFGAILIPIVTKITLSLISLVDSIKSLSTDTKKIILLIIGLVAVFGPLLLIVTALSFAFTVVSAPILIAGAAIGALIFSITALMVKWDNMTAAIEKNKKLRLFFLLFLGPIAALIVGLAILKTRWNDVTTFFKTKWGEVTTFFKTRWGEVTTFFKTRWGEIVKTLSGMSVWDAIKFSIKSTVDFGLAQFDRLLKPINTLIEKVRRLRLSTGISFVKDVASDITSFFGFEKKLPPGLNKPTFIGAGRRPAFDLQRTLDLSLGRTPVTSHSTLSGQIVVSATEGAKIKSTKLVTQGPGLDLGMNMAVGF